MLTSQPRHWIDELGMITSLLCIHCTRKLLLESRNYAKQKEKKGRNDDQLFLQKSKILYGSLYKSKKHKFFFAQIGRSSSRDLIRIFFYTEWHNFSDSLFCSIFAAVGLYPQDIDHPSTFQEKLKKDLISLRYRIRYISKCKFLY